MEFVKNFFVKNFPRQNFAPYGSYKESILLCAEDLTLLPEYARLRTIGSIKYKMTVDYSVVDYTGTMHPPVSCNLGG